MMLQMTYCFCCPFWLSKDPEPFSRFEVEFELLNVWALAAAAAAATAAACCTAIQKQKNIQVINTLEFIMNVALHLC